jgi:hypothetical protein
VPVAYVALREVAEPITELVTKVGGQPVWLEEPRWPVSRETAEPMRFLAQVALDPRLFGRTAARMAYAFVSDRVWTSDWVATDGALVLQPGPANFPHLRLSTGPALRREVRHRSGFLGWRVRRELVPCEYAADLHFTSEPTVAALDAIFEADEAAPGAWDREVEDRYEGIKVGGAPSFVQGKDYPFEPSVLVLQLATYDAPFHLPLGDAGVFYGFMDPAGTRSGVLVQCS